jgi:Protein of unknown function (DUF3168)
MQEFYQAIKHLVQTRVFALIAPSETAFPYIVYTPVASEQVIGINGLHGVVRLRMQVDVYAKTLQAANQLQDEVLGSVMAAIDTVSEVRMVNSGFDEEARVYRITVDYTYLH